MTAKDIVLVGVPTDSGSKRGGCLMGPDALRTAELGPALIDLGHKVEDRGNLAVAPRAVSDHPNANIHALAECCQWVEDLSEVSFQVADKRIPIFLGGDHLLSGGTVAGRARRAAEEGRELFVLWLDAHPDLHSLASSQSGNLHGTPVAYFTGQPGFEGFFPALEATVKPENICMMGIRSVDSAERQELAQSEIQVKDMRAIDEQGIARPLQAFLDRVAEAKGHLHVSLDVDFLDPEIAPAVGTTVPGGATFREAHLIMEMLHDSDLVTSMDLAELNPFLDERGRTAKLLVDLTASLFGRRLLDRPTRSY